MTLIYLSLAWTAGIVLAHATGATWPPLLVAAGLLAAGLVACRTRPAARLPVLLALAATLGGIRYAMAQPIIDPTHLAYYNDGEITMRGRVVADPDVRATGTQLVVTAEAVAVHGAWRNVRGRAIVSAPHYPARAYGDRLLITGRLETPPVLDGFDYRAYLAGNGIHSLLRYPRLASLPPDGRFLPMRYVLDLRHALRTLVDRLVPSPESGLLAGILLGVGHALPEDLADAFRATGLTHILIISGYNFAVVTQLAQQAFRRLAHRWVALWASLGAVALYAALVGLSPPVSRAAIMGALAVGAVLVGRKSHPLTALAAATLAMTVANPLLLWSVSFQLSFAATLGLLVALPALHRWLARRRGDPADAAPAPLWITGVGALGATAAAQLATLPVLWYHFAEVSIVSLPANALVLPLQGVVMPVGVCAVAIGAAWLPAGRLMAAPLWLILRYTTLVVEALARLPLASVRVPPAGGVVVLGLYALAAVALTLRRRPELWARVRASLAGIWRDGRAIAALGAATLLVWIIVAQLPDGGFHAHFLDVGQGDAILLRTPGGRTVLVDGGPDPVLLAARLGRALPFWQRRIDLVVATHADQDHLAGLLGVVERYDVAQVIQGPMAGGEPLQDAWQEALSARGIPVIGAARGAAIALGDDARIEVLHPPASAALGPTADDNASSIVLRIVAGNCRILLTGDIDAATEAALLATGMPLDATALKVSHHGSAGASSAPLLDAVAPEVAVISVGADNRFGHPAQATLERLEAHGARVLRTDRDGTIILSTDGRSYRLRTGGAR